MSRRNIWKYSPGFGLVLLIGSLYHRLYYRRFKVIGREKIPVKGPVIFSANHQNALMDALAVIFATRRQIVFMARADIFRKKMIARLLYFIKILPLYRIRDGFHSVDQNKEVFKEIFKVLEHNKPSAILPEGNHLGEKRLRPLKKGAARLALQTEEANNFNLGVSIVPVGIDYSNYYNAGSDLVVVFGDPIPAVDYREQYLRNPQLALSRCTDDLAAGLKKVMINIEPVEHYRTIYDAIEIFYPVELNRQHLRDTAWNRFIIKKQLSEKIAVIAREKETALRVLKTEMESHRENLARHGLHERQIADPIPNRVSLFFASCISLLLLPLHLTGMILNYLPYRLPIWLSRNIKDRHFISSVRFSAGLLLFFFWYFFMIIISFFIFKGILLNLAFIPALPLTGIFSFYYYRHLLKMGADFRWLRLKRKNREEYEGLIEERKAIISRIKELIEYSDVDK
jgi:1-acyl-sn-glycerol-3-phosphate acyltransferase